MHLSELKKSDGGNAMVNQAQKNYIGSYVSGDLGGVKVGNKSYAKYYSNPGFRMPKISYHDKCQRELYKKAQCLQEIKKF